MKLSSICKTVLYDSLLENETLVNDFKW